MNTSAEQAAAPPDSKDALAISITRDRLMDTPALDDLKRFARFALDWYAMEKARRHARSAPKEKPDLKGPVRDVVDAANRVVGLLDETATDDLPDTTVEELEVAKRNLTDRIEVLEATAEKAEMVARAQTGLLGALATAGVTAIAYRHEIEKLIIGLENMTKAGAIDSDAIATWTARARDVGALFGSVAQEEERTRIARYRARPLLEEIVRQTRFLAPRVEVQVEIPRGLRLPRATLSEWSAVFQNVLVNAFNALEGEELPRVLVHGSQEDSKSVIRVEDNGIGLDLDEADRMFLPFERGLHVSATRQRRGYAGTGLELTIVRMIAQERGAAVRFARPTAGFKTSFEMAWQERKDEHD